MIKEYNKLYIERHNKASVTLYTPTFNRGHCLQNRYEDLLNQTCQDLVWIIVNDGSNDDTDEIVRTLISKNELPICLISKPNGGKHSAFKIALEECATPYFQCMDDDDHYFSNAINRYLSEWKSINESKLKDIGAIRCLVTNNKGEYIGNLNPSHFPKSGTFDSTTLELKFIRRLHSENWTCYRTDALRDINLFPDDYWLHEKHKFFSEAIWQGRFARKYKCRYIVDVLREFSTSQAESITRSKKSDQHYLDMFINNKMILDEQFDFLCSNHIMLLKKIVLLQLTRGYLKIPLHELNKHTQSGVLKFLYTILSPVSWLGDLVINYRRKNVESKI